jgi:hypothetical protein
MREHKNPLISGASLMECVPVFQISTRNYKLMQFPVTCGGTCTTEARVNRWKNASEDL